VKLEPKHIRDRYYMRALWFERLDIRAPRWFSGLRFVQIV
jgi:hypothetical protein